MSKQTRISYCRGDGFKGERRIPIESIVSDVFDSAELNRWPARDDTQAVAAIPNVLVVSNLLYKELDIAAPEDMRTELTRKGISHSERRAMCHEFVAIRRPLI